MADLNITYLPGDIMPQYRGNQVLFIVEHGRDDPTFEEISLEEMLRGILGPDNVIRTYVGVSPEAKGQVEGRFRSGDFQHAFDLDAQIVIAERAELSYEKVRAWSEKRRNAIIDIMQTY